MSTAEVREWIERADARVSTFLKRAEEATSPVEIDYWEYAAEHWLFEARLGRSILRRMRGEF